ncbi:MAG: hypothetical protein HOP29_19170 [Phycisphaerales bacterium]|nr:hypothetical protein [Phycisphaerales bacterium]
MSSVVAVLSVSFFLFTSMALPASGGTPYPILFVTQVPIPADFATVGSVFGNHRPTMSDTGRGGDLWIRYSDGTLKNLTAAAGHGTTGFQGANAIAVREPGVHWDGTKAVFSMVIGAPTARYQAGAYHWQLYEITGLGQNESPVITRVPNQPANYNNISPLYGTDDRIIFTSDRPRDGRPHLYPQLDEYEETATVSGLWSLDPASGDLFLLNHAPSGDFTPILDSFGRVVFTQWDHLQRDQQADTDALAPPGQPAPYGTFNYSDESADSVALFGDRTEYFPEPRPGRDDLLAGTNLVGHRFNHFIPWQINEDGTEVETLNHIGRHELHGYIPNSINDDPNVIDYYGQLPRFNDRPILNMLQVKEDPTTPGRYFGADAPEFQTHSAGQVVSIDAPPSLGADEMTVTYITHHDTSAPDNTPGADHSGLYRDPLPLSDGTLIATHTPETRADQNVGTTANPMSRYDFRLKTLIPAPNGYWVAGTPLTGGISKTISYWDPDTLVSYSGPLWEWQAVEVRPRTRPMRRVPQLPTPERTVFDQAGVNVEQFRCFLVENDLALIVARDVTTRDDFDLQQPFNLRVPGTGAQTIGAPGTVYDVAHLQLFQADLLRGLTFGGSTPRPGRRVLAQPLHDPDALSANPDNPGGPIGSVAIAADGSLAGFVPARRALSWQLTAPDATPVVRERNWLTFQPGEIRVCTSCHGVNQYDQAGFTAPTNPPAALLELLQFWRIDHDPIPADMNCDSSVDLLDFSIFHACVAGPAEPAPECRIADLNAGGTVDLRDFAILQADFGV